LRSIRRRVGQIVFQSGLVAETQAIHAMRALGDTRDAEARLARLRFHGIGPPRLELFKQGNGIERARAWLQLLHDEGFVAGRQFVSRHGRDIGLHETLEIATFCIDSLKPKIPVSAHDAIAPNDAVAVP
jgi:hypothetical protein